MFKNTNNNPKMFLKSPNRLLLNKNTLQFYKNIYGLGIKRALHNK